MWSRHHVLSGRTFGLLAQAQVAGSVQWGSTINHGEAVVQSSMEMCGSLHAFEVAFSETHWFSQMFLL